MLKKIKWSILVAVTLLLAGCATPVVRVCPEYPVPNQHVIEKLTPMVLEDKEVNTWFNDLHKLQMKLELCQ